MTNKTLDTAMPFDLTPKSELPPKSVAVIGSGITGLSAAWLLSKSCRVKLFEKQDRLGGHANTVDVALSKQTLPVDAGFIVYNEQGYPNFTPFLDHLGVATEPSCMSFAVSMDDGAFEYSGKTLSSVFACKRNLVSPGYWRMLLDIPRFHKDARAVLNNQMEAQGSLGDFVKIRGYGRGFCEHFLRPMAGAIWSTPAMRIFDYPAKPFLQFFANHGLLQVLNLPQWRTITGGSREYIRAIMNDSTIECQLSSDIAMVKRLGERVCVFHDNGKTECFDAVVFATHADEALAMIDAPTPQERSILGAFQYQPNKAVLHCDPAHMPKRKQTWSSWNYVGTENEGAISYWMNRLQNLPCKEEIFITLNPTKPVAPDTIFAEFDYTHPMFNQETDKAQRDIWSIQGHGGLWYAGAHLGHGFHEDGLQAGLAVAEAIGGVKRPWQIDTPSGRLQMPDEPAQPSSLINA